MRLFFVFVLLLSLSGLFACNNTPDTLTNTVTPEKTATAIDSPQARSTSVPPVEQAENTSSIVAEEPSSKADQNPPKPKTVRVAEKRDEPENTAKKPESELLERKKNPAVPQSDPGIASPPTPVAQAESPEKIKIQAPSTTVDHSGWDALLRKYVSAQGKVNYTGLKAEQGKLQAYLDELAAHPAQPDWSRTEKMAYWINLYNAFTVKLIVDNYPVSSITDLHNGKPWDVKWIKIGDQTYSLNQVENEILRPQFKDARIHFALNCAAKSCPPLLHHAWTAEQLNSLLDQRAKAFINNPTFNVIKAKKINVSKIFDWYKADFGNLIGFLNKYSDTSIDNNAEVTYQEYDWALNN